MARDEWDESADDSDDSDVEDGAGEGGLLLRRPGNICPERPMATVMSIGSSESDCRYDGEEDKHASDPDDDVVDGELSPDEPSANRARLCRGGASVTRSSPASRKRVSISAIGCCVSRYER